MRPELTIDRELCIRGGRHPLTEVALDTFIPNDTDMGATGRVHIVTGKPFAILVLCCKFCVNSCFPWCCFLFVGTIVQNSTLDSPDIRARHKYETLQKCKFWHMMHSLTDVGLKGYGISVHPSILCTPQDAIT